MLLINRLARRDVGRKILGMACLVEFKETEEDGRDGQEAECYSADAHLWVSTRSTFFGRPRDETRDQLLQFLAAARGTGRLAVLVFF